MIELENWLPAALGDVNESHKDDVTIRDTPAADPPAGRCAMPCTILLRSQSHKE